MRVGVVGLGSMGQNHVRILSEKGVLACVADIVPEVAKAVAEKYSVEHFLSYQQLLKTDIDAVVVVTPTDTHEKVASEAIRAGKHVLLEKPMTGSSEKLRVLSAMAKERKVVLAGGFTERYNPIVDFAHRSLHAGEFGELITAATRRVSSMPTRIRDVGVIMDLGVHDIDVIQFVVGKPATSVYALGGQGKGMKYEDHANVLMGFEGGTTGFVEVNWLTPMKVRKLALTCSKNFVEVDYMDQAASVCSSSFRPFESGNLFNVPIDVDRRQIALKKEEPLKRELSDFLAAVSGGKEPLVSGENVIPTLRTAEAAIESLRTGKKVQVE